MALHAVTTWAAQVVVTMVTCWSHDCLKFEHVLFQKLTSEVVQLKNIIYNNKKFFLPLLN